MDSNKQYKNWQKCIKFLTEIKEDKKLSPDVYCSDLYNCFPDFVFEQFLDSINYSKPEIKGVRPRFAWWYLESEEVILMDRNSDGSPHKTQKYLTKEKHKQIYEFFWTHLLGHIQEADIHIKKKYKEEIVDGKTFYKEIK